MECVLLLGEATEAVRCVRLQGATSSFGEGGEHGRRREGREIAAVGD